MWCCRFNVCLRPCKEKYFCSYCVEGAWSYCYVLWDNRFSGLFPSGVFVENPLDAVGEVAEKYPQHPYGVLGGGFEVDSDERKRGQVTFVEIGEHGIRVKDI